ncbi:MAG: hypothetical protein GY811_05675 [Myxococcales bacterium]|nr:hypothetical protein [Myxococcales bacterium]
MQRYSTTAQHESALNREAELDQEHLAIVRELQDLGVLARWQELLAIEDLDENEYEEVELLDDELSEMIRDFGAGEREADWLRSAVVEAVKGGHF